MGAEVGFLPAIGLDTCMRQQGPPLMAANGSSMEHADSPFILPPTENTSGIL